MAEENSSNYSSEPEPLSLPQNVPTIQEIKLSIPGHCFRPDLHRSLTFVLKDLAISAALFLAVLVMERSPLPFMAYYPAYWLLQVTALFVFGH